MKRLPPLAGWSAGPVRHVFWDRDSTSFCGQAESAGRELEYGWGRDVPPGRCCESCEASYRAVRGRGNKRRKYAGIGGSGLCRRGHDLSIHLKRFGEYVRCGECVRLANQRYYLRRLGSNNQRAT
jgi:hypothetical protein